MASPQAPTTPLSYDRSNQRSDRVVNPSKRLTLSFPIVSPTSPLENRHSPLSTRALSPATSIASTPHPFASSQSPTGSNTFLTSLAAQERRILELREELQKAETDLLRLKKQWARDEATRKRNAMRQLEPLQPLPCPPSSRFASQDEEMTPAAAWKASVEAGRLRPVVRKSTQRVFSGSRHTRALSLLSPGVVNSRPAQPLPHEEALSPMVTMTDVHSKQSPFSRSAMSKGQVDLGFGRTYKQLAERNSLPPPAKDAIMTGGKKVAADLREGLWTFFDDIRQATVGEEGINGTETRAAVVPRRLDRQEHGRLLRSHPTGNRLNGERANGSGLREWRDAQIPRGTSPVGLEDHAVASPHM